MILFDDDTAKDLLGQLSWRSVADFFRHPPSLAHLRITRSAYERITARDRIPTFNVTAGFETPEMFRPEECAAWATEVLQYAMENIATPRPITSHCTGWKVVKQLEKEPGEDNPFRMRGALLVHERLELTSPLRLVHSALRNGFREMATVG